MIDEIILLLCSPSTGIQEEEDNCELGKQDLYQLNQWIQVHLPDDYGT